MLDNIQPLYKKDINLH